MDVAASNGVMHPWGNAIVDYYEVIDYLNTKFPIGKYPPALFIIDGAKSHKKLLLTSITKGDNMAKMREYLRAHSEHAPCETLWGEEAKGVGKGGKLSKEQLWAICVAVKAKVPTMYRAGEIFRYSRFHPTAGFLPGHEILFTPPYHLELQVLTNRPHVRIELNLAAVSQPIERVWCAAKNGERTIAPRGA